VFDLPIQNDDYSHTEYFSLQNIDIINKDENIYRLNNKFYKGNSNDILNSNSMFL